jgi:hypothetical protein
VVGARRLKEHLRQKLIDSGWRDSLKEYTMGPLAATSNRPFPLPRPSLAPSARRPLALAELIRSKGETTMTVEQLTAEIIPHGRGAHALCRPPSAPALSPQQACVLHTPLPSLLTRARLPCAGSVPDEIKSDLLQKIRKFAESQS